jgi:5-methylcytosine-specific restriction endonuclease McrA
MNDRKRYTLVLNKSFQPLGIEGVKKSLGYLVGDEGKALDPVSYEMFTFSEWIARHSIEDKDITMRTEKFWIMIPEIIVLNTNSMKKKERRSRNISKRKVFERDGHRCGYCDVVLNSKNRTIDHVVPTSRGGLNEYTNVVACCGKCNSIKGDKMLEELGWKVNHELYSPETNLLYHVPKNKRLKSWDAFLKSA